MRSRGLPICPRLGAAADFIVDDEDMLEVARWVVANTPFDRLYFYGSDLPIHVSFGPDHSRQVVRMVPAAGGRPGPLRGGGTPEPHPTPRTLAEGQLEALLRVTDISSAGTVRLRSTFLRC